MSETGPTTIYLSEYLPRLFHRDAFPDDAANLLWPRYRTQVELEFPSPKTGGQWRLTSQGWVGYIPLTPNLRLALQPRIKLANLFRMLEYAYDTDIEFPRGLVKASSLAEFYERLAKVLACRVLDRSRRGLYRTYVPESAKLPYIRGRLDVHDVMRRPWDVALTSHYEDHTADLEENQILLWTLWRVAHSGLCGEHAQQFVRRAYRGLQGMVSLEPHAARACVGRSYDRLNHDYAPMHALCGFFLDHSGPSHELGDRTMLPFLVNMEVLFERFVAVWFQRHLPDGLSVRAQENVQISEEGSVHFRIDLVLYDEVHDTVLAVLDTKYKLPKTISSADIAQVVAYAEAKGCHEAMLVYPVGITAPAIRAGSIRVSAVTFALDGDLEAAGQAFLSRVLNTRPGASRLESPTDSGFL